MINSAFPPCNGMLAVLSLLDHHQKKASTDNTRACIWITGDDDWSADLVSRIARLFRSNELAVVSERLLQSKDNTYSDDNDLAISGTFVSAHRADRLLGQEFRCVIYDCVSGVNPDALGQICGLIPGGGLLVILSYSPQSLSFFDDPEKQRLTVYPYSVADVADHFLKRFVHVLSSDPAVTRIDQEDGVSSFSSVATKGLIPVAKHEPFADQKQFIHSAMASLDQSPCAIVLTAARGRGKSAALGKVVDQWCQGNRGTAFITAPSEASVASVYRFSPHAKEAGQLTFYLPASLVELCQHESISDQSLLVIDEAAAIPVHLLCEMARYFKYIIFSTTTQGYEGTGQGFMLRFVPQLKLIQESREHSVRFYEMRQPIRWSSSDALEPCFNNLLLMGSESQPESLSVSVLPAPTRSLDSERSRNLAVSSIKVSAQWLVKHPHILASLFELLTEAHYRTTPGDLRILLDSPNLHIWIFHKGDHVIAACLAAEEGQLPEELAENIWQGRRRPRGHLMPQLLVAQAGFKEAAQFSMLRIIRIATRVSERRLGYAGELIQTIKTFAKNNSFAVLGAAFSATPNLLLFWGRAGLLPVRVGLQADQVTGSFSLLVAQPLSESANVNYEQWRGHMLVQLAFQRQDWLAAMDTEIYKMIESDRLPSKTNRLPSKSYRFYCELVLGFAGHYRAYESTAFALNCLITEHIDFLQLCSKEEPTIGLHKRILNDRVLQQENELSVIKRFDLTGKKMLIKRLREAAAWFIYQII